MPVAVARSLNQLSQSKDFRVDVKRLIGDISDVEIFFNHVLVATYIRPEKIGSIYRPDANKEEDIYQGKVGLVLKKGPMAFVDDAENSFLGQDVNIDDYIVYRTGDGWDVTINGVSCRMLADRNIRMRIKTPGIVF